MTRFPLGWLVCFVTGALATGAVAGDLVSHGNWPALASDRAAQGLGDSLTVLIQEQSQASDTSQNVAQGGGGLSGSYTAGSNGSAGQLGVSGNYSASGQHRRSGQLVAQISVVVDNVLPNGDLHVAGDQLLNINGRKTQIHLSGRVRRADIAAANTIYSTSLADATIVYGGPGLTGTDDKPGLFGRLFGWMKP